MYVKAVHSSLASSQLSVCLELPVVLARQPVVFRAEAPPEPTAAPDGRHADRQDGDHDGAEAVSRYGTGAFFVEPIARADPVLAVGDPQGDGC